MTTFKDYIGGKDVKWWDGVTRTFQRLTSTGGSLEQNKVGSVVDLLEVYGSGTAYTDVTLSTAINMIGSRPVTILFQPGTWTIAANVTIPSTMSIMVPQGATLSVSTGKTLTISGNIIAGSYVIFDGVGTIAGSPILTFKDSYWFSGTITDSTTPTYKAITEGAVTVTSLSTDTISEKTAAAGVTIDGVKLKDSEPYCDVINEKTAATGVTVDGLLIKDGGISDGTNIIKTKIINIGDWNMDTTQTVSVAHGLTYAKIKQATAEIRNDADDTTYPLPAIPSGGTDADAWVAYYNTTNVVLYRRATGLFDGPDCDATSYNRGWITITYIV